MSDKLDEMERQAIEAIERLKEEYSMAIAPYMKILTEIHNIRPHVFYVDGLTMIPILPPSTSPSATGKP